LTCRAGETAAGAEQVRAPGSCWLAGGAVRQEEQPLSCLLWCWLLSLDAMVHLPCGKMKSEHQAFYM